MVKLVLLLLGEAVRVGVTPRRLARLDLGPGRAPDVALGVHAAVAGEPVGLLACGARGSESGFVQLWSDVSGAAAKFARRGSRGAAAVRALVVDVRGHDAAGVLGVVGAVALRERAGGVREWANKGARTSNRCVPKLWHSCSAGAIVGASQRRTVVICMSQSPPQRERIQNPLSGLQPFITGTLQEGPSQPG